jgi:hypothetical protein
MTPYPRLAATAVHDGVPAVLGLDLEHGTSREVFEKCSAFDLRLDDVAIHFIVEIRMTTKELRAGVHRVPLCFVRRV